MNNNPQLPPKYTLTFIQLTSRREGFYFYYVLKVEDQIETTYHNLIILKSEGYVPVHEAEFNTLDEVLETLYNKTS
jgi:hypothetical protein